MSDEQITALGPIIKRCLDLCKALKGATLSTIQKKAASQEIDEEDIENLKSEEFGKISKVSTQVMELTGQLCEIFKNRALVVVRDNAAPYFTETLLNFKELNDDELLSTLCFWCDYVENTDANKDSNAVNQLAAKFYEVS